MSEVNDEQPSAIPSGKVETHLQVSAWQSIETAPKEARQILVARIIDNEVYWACTARWSEQYKCWFDGIEPGGLAGPTHWMTVPPTQATKSSEASHNPDDTVESSVLNKS